MKKINQIILAMIISQGVVFTTSAKDVEISPVVSNGLGAVKNAASNMWFTLDQSGSMFRMSSGVLLKDGYSYRSIHDESKLTKTDWDNYIENMKNVEFVAAGLEYGYIPYDPDKQYDIPVDYEGNKLPLPYKSTNTWRIAYKKNKLIKVNEKIDENHSTELPYENDATTYQINDKKLVSPRDIFMIYAEYMWDAKLCYLPKGVWADILDSATTCLEDPALDSKIRNITGEKTPDKLRDILSNKQGTGLFEESISEQYAPGPEFDADVKYSELGSGWHQVIPGLNHGHQYVWLKDTVCDTATDQRNCQIWKNFYSTRILALKSGLAIALRKNLINTDGSYKNIRYGYQALQTYTTNHGYVDSQINKKFKELLKKGKKTTDLQRNTKENLKKFYEWLFTFTPATKHGGTPLRSTVADLLKDIKKDAKSGVIFREDPQDENSEQYTCRQNHNIMFTDGGWEDSRADTSIDYNTAITPDENFNTEDGKTYEAMLPYKSTPSQKSTMTHLGDLAFQAWATDLDGVDTNNEEDKGGVIVDKPKKYIDKDGNYKVYTNGGSAYWHPFYDLANWQHINTHSIGFGLNDKRYKDVHINPPETQEEAKELFKMTKVVCADTDKDKYGVCKEEKGKDIVIDNLMTKEELKRSDGDKGKKGKKVGQENAITDMARAAMAGRGLFFNAKGGADVVNAFDAILARVALPPVEKAAKTGGAGTSASSDIIGNAYYTTRYNGDSFTGELIKQNLFNGKNGDKCFEDYLPNETVLEHQKRILSKVNIGADKKDEYSHIHPLGSLCDKVSWNAAKLLKADNRSILTSVNGKVKDFTTPRSTLGSFLTVSSQRNELVDNFPSQLKNLKTKLIGADYMPLQLRALFSYVQGYDYNKRAMTSANQTRLEEEFNADGDPVGNNAGFRSRDDYTFADGTVGRNILGAIVRSSAVFSGKPNLALVHLATDKPAYKAYLNKVLAKYCDKEEKTCTKPEKEVVYIGSNDGMVHAFDADTGQEIFAYLPASIYNRLPKTVIPTERLPEQVSLVDGKISLEWVNFGDKSDNDLNDNWANILVGGFGGGGNGLYSLNVTDANAAAVKDAKIGNWEYSTAQSRAYNKEQGNGEISNIGNIMWEPMIMQLSDNTWVAVTGNGYNSESKKAALIVIDLATGKPIQELVLESAGYTDSSKPNGLSQLAFTSYAQTKLSAEEAMKKINIADRAYAGDLQGNLWVFDLTKASKKCVKDKKKCITVASPTESPNNKPLFTATGKICTKYDSKLRQCTQRGDTVRLPITAAPIVQNHPTGKGSLIHFGTGALFAVNDISSNLPNALYAIWDDWIPTDNGGLKPPQINPVRDAELNHLSIKERVGYKSNGEEIIIRRPEKNKPTKWNTVNGLHRGWKVELNPDPAGSERAWQSPRMTYGVSPEEVLNYKTVRYGNSSGVKYCTRDKFSVEGWDLVFDSTDAGQELDEPALDVNGDGFINGADKALVPKLDKNGNPVLDKDGKPVLEEVNIGGLKTTGSFAYKQTDQTIIKDKACKLVSQTVIDSEGKIHKVTIPFCSHISSWQELR